MKTVFFESPNARLFYTTVFWILAILPFFLILFSPALTGWDFVIIFLAYCLIYRPVLHIFRLLHLKVISIKGAWKLFIPFYEARFIKPLWLG